MVWVNTSDDESGLSGRKLTAVAGGGNRMSGRQRRQPMSDQYDTHSDEEGGHFTKPRDIYHRRGHERSPLIRPRRSDDVLSSISSIDQAPTRYGAVTRRSTNTIQEESKSNHRLRSGSVMFFLLIMVSVIVLTAAANLNTDGQGMQVEPKHVLVYIMVLMVVFIVWTSYSILPQKFQYSSQHDGALIPSHLLTGVGIFGTFCATTQMLLFVDFVKCRRHVGNLSVVYGIYPFLKSFFVYFQIYFFYKLSRNGIRDRKLPGGNFLVMVTLATNMCIWWAVFLNDASSNPKLKGVSWLNHYYYGINGYDPCANATITSPQILKLHSIIVDFQPYISTFSMEYALLASGLLLHIWMAIKAPLSTQTHRSEQQYWTLWRLGFILGLLCIPTLFVVYFSESYNTKISAGKAVLYACKGIIYLFLVVLCRYCTILLDKSSGFVKRVRSMQLEVILLGISFIGFPVLDICSVFAIVSEFGNFPISEMVWHGIACVAELVAVSLQFLFIKKAYEHKLPEVASVKVRKSARLIRQFSSFALVVNLGYWAGKTYELRKHDSRPSIPEQFFGSYEWFAVRHVAYPLCIFFQFHVATCYADVVRIFSQFGDFANPIQNSGNY